MFTFNYEKLIYFFVNEQLYKIIDIKESKNNNENRNKFKIVEILPKTIENTQTSETSGICKIYYDMDYINYNNAFYISNKKMKGINWLQKREELHLRNNQFIFETYKLYDRIFFNKIRCIQIM